MARPRSSSRSSARQTLRATLAQRSNGSEFTLDGRRFLTNYDGSQDEDDKSNDEVLQEFLDAFEAMIAKRLAHQRDPNNRDQRRATCRLPDGARGSLPRICAALVLAGLAGSPPADGVVAVNLNLRSIVAEPLGARRPTQSSIGWYGG